MTGITTTSITQYSSIWCIALFCLRNTQTSSSLQCIVIYKTTILLCWKSKCERIYTRQKHWLKMRYWEFSVYCIYEFLSIVYMLYIYIYKYSNNPIFDISSVYTYLWCLLPITIWCSTIPHLPGCFCPWTFFQNIGFNMVPSDPFMSHLATQPGYSAGEFQALQLIVLATFGVVD